MLLKKALKFTDTAISSERNLNPFYIESNSKNGVLIDAETNGEKGVQIV